jgi:N-formylglutamate amidohydrolase
MNTRQRDDLPGPRLHDSGDVELRPSEPELQPPIDVLAPLRLLTPLVFSSPHSGSIYPQSFLDSTKLDPMNLRRSEDAFVDQLFLFARDLGAPLLRAHFPRAYLDVNREPYELDPRMFEGRLPPFANTRSLRVAGGLGTIARVVGDSQEIYARRLPVAAALERIDRLYKPYHRALRCLLQQASAEFGVALLIDCHSLPSTGNDRPRSDIVLGDRYGTSCASIVLDLMEYELRRLGYSVHRNKPYAGGFITEHYGNPQAGTHAVQIELNRALYMDEAAMVPNRGFEPLAKDLRTMSVAVAAAVGASWQGQKAAAE